MKIIARIIGILFLMAVSLFHSGDAYAEESSPCWLKAVNDDAYLCLKCSYAKQYAVEWYGGTVFDDDRKLKLANGQGYIIFRNIRTGYQSGRISSLVNRGYLKNNIVINDMFLCLDNECSEVEIKIQNGKQYYRGIVSFDQSISKIESLLDGLLLDYGNNLYYNGTFTGNMAQGEGKICFGEIPTGKSLAGLSDADECPFPMSYQDGNWDKGKFISGEGRVLFKDGGMYEGSIEDGKISGWGRYLWSDGSIFYGEFLNGERNGYGTYKYADGSIYEGEWQKNRKAGFGSLIITPNGVEYQGEFLSGKIHGQGVMRFQDKFTYVGNFVDNRPHSDGNGHDVIIDKDGNSYSVRFDEGVLIDIEPHGNAANLQEIRRLLDPVSFKEYIKTAAKKDTVKHPAKTSAKNETIKNQKGHNVFDSVESWMVKNKDHIINAGKGCMAGAAGGAISGGAGGAITGSVITGFGTVAGAGAGAATGALNGCINQGMNAWDVSRANNGKYTREQLIAAMKDEISAENFALGAFTAAGAGVVKTANKAIPKVVSKGFIAYQLSSDVARGEGLSGVVLDTLLYSNVGGRITNKILVKQLITKSKLISKVGTKCAKIINKVQSNVGVQTKHLQTSKLNQRSKNKLSKSKLAGKKEFEEKCTKKLEGDAKIVYHETSVRGGGSIGTRRPDKMIADDKRKIITRTETKSPREARNPTSWCGSYPNDYLPECREKIKSKYGGCNKSSAWMIVIACQANCYRQSTFKDQKLNDKYKSYKKQTGLLVPKEHLNDINDSLKKLGVSTCKSPKLYADGVLCEFSEDAMDAITSKLGIAKDLAGRCTAK
jgi:hypothetical protein